METISFWSLRDNNERADLLVKVAQSLLEMDKTVFVLDANVFSPELHLKLLDGNYKKSLKYSKKTFLDYLTVFQSEEMAPYYLDDYIIKEGKMLFLSSCYSSIIDSAKMAQFIDWIYFFPPANEETEPHGINLLLDLQSRIRDQYEADYLLINTPAGTTSLSMNLNWVIVDKCLYLNSGDKDEEEYLAYSRKQSKMLEKKSGYKTKLVLDIEDLDLK